MLVFLVLLGKGDIGLSLSKTVWMLVFLVLLREGDIGFSLSKPDWMLVRTLGANVGFLILMYLRR